MRETTCCGATALPTVRAARDDDLSEALEILARRELPLDGVMDGFGPDWVVAEEGEELVGVAGLEAHGSHGLLRSVAVSPSREGRGVGERLVREQTARARARGFEALWLLTTTARDWFERRGFREVDRSEAPAAVRASREFSSVCPSTANLMKLDLTGGSDEIRAHYARAARIAAQGGRAGCGTADGCGSPVEAKSPITSDLYGGGETEGLPVEALLASLGCGNPTALAHLAPGETVLDLGSGGGIDVLLSARRVGPDGKAYGLDITDEMLELARENQRRAGITNAEFLRGDMEAIPLPDGSVDVVISNCVINLAADKARVLREAFRVLRPGGRFAVSDIVVRGPLPEDVRRSVELRVGCVAGALDEADYRRLLVAAGFMDTEVEPTRVYGVDDARSLLGSAGMSDEQLVGAVTDRLMSAFIRARKPRVREP
jgi:arsenite methyltransferase